MGDQFKQIPRDGIGLRGIDHVGIAVTDLDAAIEHYGHLFGMHCVHVEENAEQEVREAMLSVSPEPGSGFLQLLAPLTSGSPIARFLEKSGPGVQQVAFTVEDVREAGRVLRSRGARLLYEEPRPGTAGSLVNFLHPRDAGGVLVELVEPAAAGRK